MCGRGWDEYWHTTPLGHMFDDSFVDDDDVTDLRPSTRLDELHNLGMPLLPKSFWNPTDFGNETFEDAYHKMKDASEDIAPSFTTEWASIAETIRNARNDFRDFLTQLGDDPNWESVTAAAAVNNARQSLPMMESVAASADVMSVLVDAFSRAVTTTKHSFTDNWEMYQHDTNESLVGKATAEDAKSEYNSFAHQVLDTHVYKPTLKSVAEGHPDLSGIAAATVGPAPDYPWSPGAGPGGPGGAGPLSSSGLGVPELPTMPEMPAAMNAVPESSPAGTPNIPTEAAKAAGDAAKGMGDAASQGANQGLNAAKDALSEALKNTGGTSPELSDGMSAGLLAAAAKDMGGAPKGGASGGSGGGRAGGLPAAKPSLPTLATTAEKATAATPSSRAGVSAAGAPGAGAPAAASRGGSGDGSVHKVNKALRQRKNGEDLVGDAEAVVPVIGELAREPEPAKPGPS